MTSTARQFVVVRHDHWIDGKSVAPASGSYRATIDPTCRGKGDDVAAGGPEDVEYAAVIDLQANAVVAVEVQRQGEKQARWTWEDGKLIVASADGLTDEFQLRQPPAKEPAPVAARRAPDPWRKAKSLFDLIFGN